MLLIPIYIYTRGGSYSTRFNPAIHSDDNLFYRRRDEVFAQDISGCLAGEEERDSFLREVSVIARARALI